MGKKSKKYIRIAFLFLFIISIYIMGKTQGRMMSNAQYAMSSCDDPIYPYGCKIHNNATHCFNIDCQKFGYNDNAALCTKADLEEINNVQKIQANLLGLVVFGCPMSIEEIGINPITKNENWWIK